MVGQADKCRHRPPGPGGAGRPEETENRAQCYQEALDSVAHFSETPTLHETVTNLRYHDENCQTRSPRLWVQG